MNDAAWSDKAFNRNEQRQQKRMAVLRAGALLFRKRGFDRTSLEDIASELEVSKRTLYYYVKSKDDILYQCNRLALEFMDEALQQAALKETPPLSRIELLLRHYGRLLDNDFGACLVMLRDDMLAEDYHATLRNGRKKLDYTLRDLIQEGIDDGSLSPCEPKYAAAAIYGALNWIPHWHTDKEKLSYEEITDQILTTFLYGLKSEGSDPCNPMKNKENSS